MRVNSGAHCGQGGNPECFIEKASHAALTFFRLTRNLLDDTIQILGGPFLLSLSYGLCRGFDSIVLHQLLARPNFSAHPLELWIFLPANILCCETLLIFSSLIVI